MLQAPTLLSKTYFSRENIQILQNAIRRQVSDMTQGKHVVAKQSEVELNIVMRSVFLQYSLNRDDDIAGQIETLNEHVLKFSVPRVHSNMQQYLQYKKDVTQLPLPLRHAPNVSIKGDKSLMLNPFF